MFREYGTHLDGIYKVDAKVTRFKGFDKTKKVKKKKRLRTHLFIEFKEKKTRKSKKNLNFSQNFFFQSPKNENVLKEYKYR